MTVCRKFVKIPVLFLEHESPVGLYVDCGAEGPGGLGSVFCAGPPARETDARIRDIQEKTTSSGEFVFD